MRWSFASIVLVPRGEWGEPPPDDKRRRIFSWAARAGFEGVELSPRWLDFHRLAEAELRRLRSEIQDEGLCVSGLNVSRSILTRTEKAREHLERLRRAVEVAAILSAPVITISLSMPTPPTADRTLLRGSQFPEAEREETADLLRSLAAAAESCGVQLSLELHDDGLLDTPELLQDMVRRADAANVGANPDLGNVCRSNGSFDWRGALETLAPRANCWHVKNYRGGQPAPLWDGDIDYAQAMAIMTARGYAGWVSIEGYQGDVLASQQASLEYLKQLAAGGASGSAGADVLGELPLQRSDNRTAPPDEDEPRLAEPALQRPDPQALGK
jgi:sugar phosphate isomerase/epimerase